ncbi:hypothetical protein VVD49_05145 [Uliginosibacterium sp. H3]|uniref:Uncharacterized protein n=1 Tax=Uliginosibacterium silvisoli TaxID=3114758 RepID=A0ABU6JZJ9_9RHOO|nr:hypothetical protein [Uliginosibacterium sp. H3]
MKHRIAIALATLSLLGAEVVLAAGEHDHKPAHGGIVVEVKEVQYELIARTDTLQLYVSDHGKPVKLDGASARITLLSGTDKQEVELKPAGDKLEAKGSFKVSAGTKVLASVSLPGKAAASARFTIK